MPNNLYDDITDFPSQNTSGGNLYGSYDDISDFPNQPGKYSGNPLKGLWDVTGGVLSDMYNQVNTTGKTAAQHLKEGNYPGAFHDISSFVTDPFESVTKMNLNLIRGKDQPFISPINIPEDAGTRKSMGIDQLIGATGIPAGRLREAWESSDYPRLVGQGVGALGAMYLMHKLGGFGGAEKPVEKPPFLSDKFDYEGGQQPLDFGPYTPEPRQQMLPMEPNPPMTEPAPYPSFGVSNLRQGRHRWGQVISPDIQQQGLPSDMFVGPNGENLNLQSEPTRAPFFSEPGPRTRQSAPIVEEPPPVDIPPPVVEQPPVPPPQTDIPSASSGRLAGKTVVVPNAELTPEYIANMEKNGYKIFNQTATHTAFKPWTNETGAVRWGNRPPRVPVHGDEQIPDLAFQPDEGVSSNREFSEHFLPEEGRDVQNATSREEINKETRIAPEGLMNEIVTSYPTILEEAKAIYNETDPKIISENLARYSAVEKITASEFNEAQSNRLKNNIPVPQNIQSNFNKIFRLKALAQAKYERAGIRGVEGRPETTGRRVGGFWTSEEGSVNLDSIRRTLRDLFGMEPTEEQVQKAAFQQRELEPGAIGSTGNVANFHEPAAPPDPNAIDLRVIDTATPDTIHNIYEHWNDEYQSSGDPHAADMATRARLKQIELGRLTREQSGRYNPPPPDRVDNTPTLGGPEFQAVGEEDVARPEIPSQQAQSPEQAAFDLARERFGMGIGEAPVTNDIAGLRPRAMDPRMESRVETGGPRMFDFTQPKGQQELPLGPHGEMFPRELPEDANLQIHEPIPEGQQPRQSGLDFDPNPPKPRSGLMDERGSIDWSNKDKVIIDAFKEHLPRAKSDSWKDTRFILPDGTRLTHESQIHADAAHQIGTNLDSVLKAGIARVSVGFDGVEVSRPITMAQAEAIVDSMAYSGRGKVYVDTNVSNSNMMGRGRQYVAVEEGASARDIREQINNKFRSGGGRFDSETGSLNTESLSRAWQDVKEKMGWGQGASKSGKMDPEATNYIKEAIAVPGAATTTGDFSAPGRQGLALINTKQFWQAIPKMFKGVSEKAFDRMDAELRSKDLMTPRIDAKGNIGKSFGEEIGIKLFTPASKPGPHAESIASRWLETGGSIPYFSKAYKNTVGVPIRATNRAYITFLNQLNVNRAEFLLNSARDMAIEGIEKGSVRQGVMPWRTKVTPEQAMDLNPYHNVVLAKEIADFVNTATGHAPLKMHYLPYKGAEISLEGAASKLNSVLFSPGLLFSRMRMLNPNTYIMASPYVRKQYMKAALATAGAWYGFTEMAKLAGGDQVTVNNDPTNADFGKVRIGDTRMDPGGGFSQFLVAYGRAYMGGSTSSASGEFHRFGSGYQAQTQEDMMQRFFVNKLNPVAKFAYDLYSASEYNPFHVGDRTAQLFVPLAVQDMYELYKENPKLLPWMGPVALGMGTQTYSKGESVGKLIDPENDWLVTGGGMRDLMPWNWNEREGQ